MSIYLYKYMVIGLLGKQPYKTNANAPSAIPQGGVENCTTIRDLQAFAKSLRKRLLRIVALLRSWTIQVQPRLVSLDPLPMITVDLSHVEVVRRHSTNVGSRKQIMICLCMEYLEVGQVNDLKHIQDNTIDSLTTSNRLGQLYSEMIFNTGFVHSDPHPGIILVRKDPKFGVEIIILVSMPT
uniref:ABC1 atypical kinase-like domain-containing protein n=1 Tax=Glossina brevipalpis TaxID=37001 RepID=A0A1A9W9M0_9MUSC